MQDISPIVDLTFIRSITSGDHALEQELFALFYSTVNRCVDSLRPLQMHDAKSEWQPILHELKGACLNIGAHGLGSLCQTAEHVTVSEAEKRAHFFLLIEAEAQDVIRYLKGVSYD